MICCIIVEISIKKVDQPSQQVLFAGRQDKGRPAAFQAEDRGVRLSLPAPRS